VIRAAIRPVGRKLRRLQTVDEMWPAVMEAASLLEAAAVRLELSTTDNATPVNFSHELQDETGEPRRRWSRFSVPTGKSSSCVLELCWADGLSEIDRDTEIAVEIFCEYLGDALDLVRPVAAIARSRSSVEPHV
jgi:hypothetical protein